MITGAFGTDRSRRTSAATVSPQSRSVLGTVVRVVENARYGLVAAHLPGELWELQYQIPTDTQERPLTLPWRFYEPPLLPVIPVYLAALGTNLQGTTVVRCQYEDRVGGPGSRATRWIPLLLTPAEGLLAYSLLRTGDEYIGRCRALRMNGPSCSTDATQVIHIP